jgi:hypothetical protein
VEAAAAEEPAAIAEPETATREAADAGDQPAAEAVSDEEAGA